MTDRELMQQALYALEIYGAMAPAVNDTIIAMRERLAQPKRQPQQDDPCPGCRKGGVCRTPKCGRLKLPVDHPYRSEQPEQEPVAQEPLDKAGSPCPEFWDWLPKAYRDGDKGADPKFTKYNMEVAYLAGSTTYKELLNKSEARLHEIAVHCERVERRLKDVNTAAMNLTHDLVCMNYDDDDRLDRDRVMERITRWRIQWDKAMFEERNT